MESALQVSDAQDVGHAQRRTKQRAHVESELRETVDQLAAPYAAHSPSSNAEQSGELHAIIPVSALKEHVVAREIPNVTVDQFEQMVANAKTTGSVGPRQVVVLPDQQTVIFGFQELRVAQQAKLPSLTCLIRSEADPRGYALQQTLLMPQWTKDQLAVIAWKLTQHLSKQYKAERATKAALSKNAAAMQSSLSVQGDDKVVEKKDARKEVAAIRGVSERSLKNLAAIAKHEKEHNHKGESVIAQIMARKTTIAAEAKRIETMLADSKKAAEAEQLAALPILEDWQTGEAVNVVRDRLSERTIEVLLLDEVDLGTDELDRLLKVLLPSLDPSGSVVCITSFGHEVGMRTQLSSHNLTVERPLLIDSSRSRQGLLGTRHLSVLRATQFSSTSPQGKIPESDILVEPAFNGRAFALQAVLGLFARPHTLVVQPFANDESGYLAARRLERSVLAVAVSDDAHKAGRTRIDEALASAGSEGGAK